MKQYRALQPPASLRNWHGERVSVEMPERHPEARLRAYELGSARLIVLRCGEARITRSPHDAAEARERAFTFLFMVSGRAELEHFGRCLSLGEGDLTLCDNSAAYKLHFEGRAEAILLRVPAAVAKGYLPSPECFCGHRLGATDGLTSMASAMAADLARRLDGVVDEENRERAARYLLEVVGSCYATRLSHLVPASPVMTGRLWTVKLHVEQSLRDPGLSPSRVAEKLKLSDRYLRIVFAASKESLSAYILRRRLEESARQLIDPRWRGHSITEIAFSWGFNSAPHFARRFRERFDMSPRDYRQRHAASAGKPGAEPGWPA